MAIPANRVLIELKPALSIIVVKGTSWIDRVIDGHCSSLFTSAHHNLSFQVAAFGSASNFSFRTLVPIEFACIIPRVARSFASFDSNSSLLVNYSLFENDSDLIQEMQL